MGSDLALSHLQRPRVEKRNKCDNARHNPICLEPGRGRCPGPLQNEDEGGKIFISIRQLVEGIYFNDNLF